MAKLWNLENARKGNYSFDGDINIKVTTDYGVDDESEIDTAVADNNDVNETTFHMEMMSLESEVVDATMRRIEGCRRYIQQYGITKELMALQNYDGFLSEYVVPNVSMESLSHSNRSSRMAKFHFEVAMENLAEAAKKVWEWIKKMCRKLVDWLKELWAKFMGLFENQKAHLQRLKSMLNGRRNIDFENNDAPSIKVLSKDNFKTRKQRIDEIIKTATSMGLDNLENAGPTSDSDLEAFKKKSEDHTSFLEEDVEWDTVEANEAVSNATSWINDGLSTYDNIQVVERTIKKINTGAKRLQTKSDELAKKSDDASNYKAINRRMINLDGSEEDLYEHEAETMERQYSSETQKKMLKGDSVAEQQAADKDLSKQYKNTVDKMNKLATLLSKVLNAIKKLVSGASTSASRYISKGTVTRS